MRKIDIHNHVLSGFDDGASNEEESMRMLKSAVKQGVISIIATPHCSAEYPNNRGEEIRRACEKLEKRVRNEINPKFSIYPGQEILYTQDILEKLERQEVLTMADSSYVLVEFMPWTPYSEIYRAVRTLTTKGYSPILAHVERYPVLREKGRVDELIQTGASMQMNYRPVGGKWYAETTRWCRKMLKENKIHFLSTDMHNMKARKPDTKEADAWMEKHLDRIYMRAVCYKNAQKIIGKSE